MDYRKLIANVFAQRSNNNAKTAVALIAGLAVGAVIGVLFAPDSGDETRKGIAGKAKGLGEGVKDIYASLRSRLIGETEIDEITIDPTISYVTQPVPKRPKSDIKDLIHEAHTHTEQSIS